MKIAVFWDATYYSPKSGTALSMMTWSSCLVEDGDFTAKSVVVDKRTSLLSRLVGRLSVTISVSNNPHAGIRSTDTERCPDQYLRVVWKQTVYGVSFLSECLVTGAVYVGTLKVLLIQKLFRSSDILSWSASAIFPFHFGLDSWIESLTENSLVGLFMPLEHLVHPNLHHYGFSPGSG